MVEIVRTAIVVSDEDVADAVKRSEGVGYIFNQPRGRNDRLRKQRTMTRRWPLGVRIRRAIVKKFGSGSSAPGTMVLLRSEPGCARQRWHTDYPAPAVRDLARPPFGCLTALMPNTTLDIWPNQVIKLDPGDMVFFRGDVVHAGSAYEQLNVRVHTYIESPELKRRPNRTYEHSSPAYE